VVADIGAARGYGTSGSSCRIGHLASGGWRCRRCSCRRMRSCCCRRRRSCRCVSRCSSSSRCSTRRRRWCWTRHTAGQRESICAATACPDRERRGAAVDLHVPHHRVRDTVLKAQPGWRSHGNIIRVVNPPVCARKNLLWHVRIDDDRIHGNVWEIACLIYPCEGAAVSSAGYLEHVTRTARGVFVKAAYRRVTNRQIGGRHCRIQRDTLHRAERQNGVIPCYIYPVSL